MLVYRLTIHQQEYFYFREDIQNETGLHTGEYKILVDWSHSISEGGRFLKTN